MANPDRKTIEEAYIIMFMGQSNMAGRGISTMEHPEKTPEVMAGAGYEYRAVTAPDRLFPLKEPFGVNENRQDGLNDGMKKTGGLTAAFVNSFFDRNDHVPVIGVSASKGGSSISQWQPEAECGFLKDAAKRLRSCVEYVEEAGIKTKGVYMLWCQGETDGDIGTARNEYFRMLRTTFDYMKEAGVERIFTIQIGCCNISGSLDRYDAMQEWQVEFARENSDVDLVDCSFKTMLARGLMKDEFHYFQQAYNEAGASAGRNTADLLK